MRSSIRKKEPIIPNEREIEIAKVSSRTLAKFLPKRKPKAGKTVEKAKSDFILSNSDGSMKLDLPNSVVKMLFEILTQMSKGNPITLIPSHAEVTTQEAANILNVSRPFLIKLLEEEKIPYKMVGTRRKILLKDLMDFQTSMYRARSQTLDELAQDAQDLDMGY